MFMNRSNYADMREECRHFVNDCNILAQLNADVQNKIKVP